MECYWRPCCPVKSEGSDAGCLRTAWNWNVVLVRHFAAVVAVGTAAVDADFVALLRSDADCCSVDCWDCYFAIAVDGSSVVAIEIAERIVEIAVGRNLVWKRRG